MRYLAYHIIARPVFVIAYLRSSKYY